MTGSFSGHFSPHEMLKTNRSCFNICNFNIGLEDKYYFIRLKANIRKKLKWHKTFNFEYINQPNLLLL